MEKLFSNVDERLMEQEEERVEDDESECPVPPAKKRILPSANASSTASFE